MTIDLPNARSTEFRETFANTVGTFDEYPMPGYLGLTQIISTRVLVLNV